MLSEPTRRAATPAHRHHPIWLCAFRPFFLLAASAAFLTLLLWLLFLLQNWPLPAVPGGALAWHAHELLFGFALAGLAGFSLTAIPEFTRTAACDVRTLRRLVSLWLLGRAAFWLSGWWPIPMLALSALAHLLLLDRLARWIVPRVWTAAGRRHLAFVWAVLALAVCVAGFYFDALREQHPMRWLHASIGVMMALIVVAMSRISMQIVNSSIDEAWRSRQAVVGFPGGSTTDPTAAADVITVQASSPAPQPYLARPPRRNLAVACIALFTFAHWWGAPAGLAGWLALAASAAMLNLLGDWHVGRPLFRRWPAMLYAVYLSMAAGYGTIGSSLLGAGGPPSAGLHLLTIGGIGLAVYVVICIAGHTHSGLDKDGRLWVPVGAALIIAACVLRALAYAGPYTVLIGLSGAAWIVAYGLLLWQMAPVFLSARRDGGIGCEGIIAPPAAESRRA